MKIEKPCTENFSVMTKNNSGRHCSSCNITVIDFTKMNANEIQDHLARATGEVCGRFKSLQLEQRNGFQKLIFQLQERVFNFNVRPMRIAFLTLISGITAFTSSCMGKVQNSYDSNEKNQSKDPVKVKQDSLNRN